MLKVAIEKGSGLRIYRKQIKYDYEHDNKELFSKISLQTMIKIVKDPLEI